MADIKIVKETEYYWLFVSPTMEGISHEPHYAVQNKEFGVVEFRSPNLFHALSVMDDAENYFKKEFKKEKSVKILSPEDIDGEVKNVKFKH